MICRQQGLPPIPGRAWGSASFLQLALSVCHKALELRRRGPLQCVCSMNAAGIENPSARTAEPKPNFMNFNAFTLQPLVSPAPALILADSRLDATPFQGSWLSAPLGVHTKGLQQNLRLPSSYNEGARVDGGPPLRTTIGWPARSPGAAPA